MSRPHGESGSAFVTTTSLAMAGWTPPLLVRASLLSSSGVPAARVDLIGLGSDLAMGLLVAGLIGVIATRTRALALLVGAVWTLANYASFEHVRVLGAGLQLAFARYLADPTFLLGSALQVSSPLLLAVMLVACLLATRLGSRGLPTRGPRWGWLLVGAVGVALPVQWTGTDHQALAWRQRHFLQQELETLFGSVIGSGGRRATITLPPAELSADLRGTPRMSLPGRARNVLLVVLEGLPGSVIDSLTDGSTEDRSLVMPRLSRLAERAMLATNFVLHQRQTNRGLYSLLCGDYPRLDHSIAKMSAYVNDASRDCLPRVLNAAGYQTVYLQSAPLSFMYKDLFAERAGFKAVYGNIDFADPIHRSQWGVDDRSLFDEAVRRIDTLEREGAPWFVTLLSVGTHHPSVVPPAFEKRSTREGFAAAVEFLDSALGDFVDGLRRAGVLENTLLIITSDESRGSPASSDVQDVLSRSWGPLVISMPEAHRERIAAPYGQSDVALSILDYLGLASQRGAFIGRSLFRQYAEPRRLYFGNVFLRRTGAVDGRGFSFLCDEPAEVCSRYAADPATLFRPEGPALDSDEADRLRIRSVIEYSIGNTLDLGTEFSFVLTGRESIPIVSPAPQSLMDGQNIDFPPLSRVDVEIVFTLESDGGTIDVVHQLTEKGYVDFLSRELKDLQPRDRVSIRYAFGTKSRTMRNVRFQLVAHGQGDDRFNVHILKAEVRVSPLREEMERPGFIGEPSFEIVRARATGAGNGSEW